MIRAFSGVGNTGKSYCVDSQEGFVKYPEIARKHFDKLPHVKKFQEAILEEEKNRLWYLLEYGQDYDIVVDRTFADNICYFYYNILKQKINGSINLDGIDEYIQESYDLYDEVILFTEPLKENTQFKQYNDPELNNLMISTIRTIYGNKVKEYKNSKEYLTQQDTT